MKQTGGDCNRAVPLDLAYLDESGNTDVAKGSEYFLVVAVVAGDDATCRSLGLHVKRLKNSLNRKSENKRVKRTRVSELKASAASPEQLERLLTAAAAENIEIIVAVVDKGSARQIPKDREDWYREAVSLAARECTRRHPGLKLVLDKRYTVQARRDKLDQAIKEGCPSLGSRLEIEHADSQVELPLQVADYVAWAIKQRYERGEEKYYQLIKSRIVFEEEIAEKVVEAKV